MHLFPPRDRRATPRLLGYLVLSATLAAIGCASPGPPRAPSLHLPQPVRDLTATRIGNTVELQFTAPSRTTDKLPIRGGTVTGQLCRQLPHQPCVAVPSSKTSIPTANPHGANNIVTWTDTLPPALILGPPQLLAYRVEFFSPTGRSAGRSAPAFTATGPAPAPVEGLHAEGTRLGTLLTWNPSPQPGEVLLRREDMAPAKPKPHNNLTPITTTPAEPSSPAQPTIVWLQTHPSNTPQPSHTLDTTALPDTPYRYLALRRVTLQLGASPIDLRSEPTAPIPFILHQIYPPPTPTGLTALGFFTPTTPTTFAIDLIWQPVDDAGLITPLAGYNLYREPLTPTGEPAAPRQQLNTAPIPTPAFHDPTASPTTPYRYSVTAIDAKGNQSPATTTLIQPSTTP
jgi:hypothetical protein